MAAELVTPDDKLTGLPLPIFIPRGFEDDPDKNYHHHFHPRTDTALTGIDGGLALRMSRGQLISKRLHDRYHRWYRGPALPADAAEKFRLSVLACAGVVSRTALDVSNGMLATVELDDRDYERMVISNSIQIEKGHKLSIFLTKRTIGSFYARFALEQNIEEIVTKRMINRFLNAPNEARKREIGHLILREALHEPLRSVRSIHHEAVREGYLVPQRATEPDHVVRKFMTERHYDEYRAGLTAQLAA